MTWEDFSLRSRDTAADGWSDGTSRQDHVGRLRGTFVEPLDRLCAALSPKLYLVVCGVGAGLVVVITLTLVGQFVRSVLIH